jgi:hypothetical protein
MTGKQESENRLWKKRSFDHGPGDPSRGWEEYRKTNLKVDQAMAPPGVSDRNPLPSGLLQVNRILIHESALGRLKDTDDSKTHFLVKLVGRFVPNRIGS